MLSGLSSRTLKVLLRSLTLKARFLSERPTPAPRVADFWATYQQVFSAEGLEQANPAAFHYFANSPVGADAGQMTVFNNTWSEIGAQEGARRVAEAISYLLYGSRTSASRTASRISCIPPALLA